MLACWLEVLAFEGFVEGFFDDVLHYVGGQDGLQAIEDFLGVEHEGLVAGVPRPLSQRVHHTQKATRDPPQILLVEAGGGHAHYGVHAGWLYLARLGVREKGTVPGQDTLDDLPSIEHGLSLVYGQVGGCDDPERLYLMGVPALRVVSNNLEKLGECFAVLRHRLLLALVFVSGTTSAPAQGVYPPELQGIRSHEETRATCRARSRRVPSG